MAFVRGTFVRHPSKGDAVVVVVRQGKLDVLYESGERQTLLQKWVEQKCKVIAAADLAKHSNLGDATKWDPAPVRPPRAPRAAAGNGCPTCALPLNRYQYSGDRALKSCPKCSADAGFHVFHPHPEAYGTTDARVNDASPEGVQSYCAPCRADEDPLAGTPCAQVIK